MKIACVLGQGFEDSEFRIPYDRLKAAGYQVDVIGVKAGEELKGYKGKEKVKADKSIDQVLLASANANLGGKPVASIQSTAYRASSVSLPAFRVMSYAGNNQPLFPECRPATLFDQIFGSASADLTPEALARLRTQNRSILDFVEKYL